MTASTSTYTVGKGRPPLHTRFKKGQSGNPSGKPGPARLAKQRFQRALFAALEGSEAQLELSRPGNVIAALARRMALDAAAGRTASQRLVLSLIDAETAKETQAEAEAEAREEADIEAEALSLVQGKLQGNGIECLEDMLWPGVDLKALEADEPAQPGQRSEPRAAAPARNKPQPVSLLQGKKQGNEKKLPEQICAALDRGRAPGVPRSRTERRAGLMMSAAHDIFPQRACAGGM